MAERFRHLMSARFDRCDPQRVISGSYEAMVRDGTDVERVADGDERRLAAEQDPVPG